MTETNGTAGASDGKDVNGPKDANDVKDRNGGQGSSPESGKEGEEFSEKKREDEKPQGRIGKLFGRIRQMFMEFVNRAKSLADRAIGRNRIVQPAAKRAPIFRNRQDPDRTGRSVDDKQKERSSIRELLFHGFARLLLGQKAYMHAVMNAEKAEQEAKQQGQQPTKGGQDEKSQGNREDQQGGEKKQEDKTEEKTDQKDNSQNQKEQAKPEEMKGLINSLHKVFTDDLEKQYTNAKEKKEEFLNHYCEHLAEKLASVNGNKAVSVGYSRYPESGEITFWIDARTSGDSYGEAFRGMKHVEVTIDKYMNVEAHGIRSDDKDVNLSFVFGKYVAADLADNFRSSYNKSNDSYNLTSRREFEKSIMENLRDGKIMDDKIMDGGQEYTIHKPDENLDLAGDGHGPFGGAILRLAPEDYFTVEFADGRTMDIINPDLVTKQEDGLKKAEEELNSLKQFRDGKTENAPKEYKDMLQEKARLEGLIKKNTTEYYRLNDAAKLNDSNQNQMSANEYRERKQELDMARLENGDKGREYSRELDAVNQKLEEYKNGLDARIQDAEKAVDSGRESTEYWKKISKEWMDGLYSVHKDNVIHDREMIIRLFEGSMASRVNDFGQPERLDELEKYAEQAWEKDQNLEDYYKEVNDIQKDHDPEEKGYGEPEQDKEKDEQEQTQDERA